MRLFEQKVCKSKYKTFYPEHGYNISFNSWYTKMNRIKSNNRFSENTTTAIDYIIIDDEKYDVISFDGSCGFHYYIRNMKINGIEGYYLTKLRFKL